MKRIVALMLICMFTVSFAQKSEAQQTQPKHEITFGGGFGISTLKYDLSFGNKNCGLGWNAGLGYNYFFNYNWAFGIGAEYSVLSGELALPNFKDNYRITSAVVSDRNVPGLDLETRTAQSPAFKQIQNLAYINVPITLLYQTDFWKQHKFYAAGGVKVGYALDAKYSSEGNFEARGFNIDKHGETSGTAFGMQNHGFGTRTEGTIKDQAFGVNDINVMLTVEPGFKWRLSDKFSLYTGVFLDYGLTEVRKNTDNAVHLFQYDNPTGLDFGGYTINNVLESQYARESTDIGNEKAFTNRVSTISAGLKLRLGFGFGAPRVKAVKEVPEAPKTLSAGEIDDIVGRNAQRIIDSQNDGFNDLKDLLNKYLKKEKEEVKAGIRLETVREFELDKSAIRSVMNTTLQNNLAALRSHPELRIRLVGHTDEIASNEYNYHLGMRRAQSIKDWLVSQGIEGSRLIVSSRGNLEHEIPNVDEATRKYNRRVEFLIDK